MGKRIAFIGLGVMGAPIAMHLASHGHKMTVYNRTFEKADAWVAQYGGAAFSSPRAASEGAQFVFSCVGDDEDLRSVAIGKDQAFSGMSPGAMFIDHTTTSAEVARERGTLRQLAQLLARVVEDGEVGDVGDVCDVFDVGPLVCCKESYSPPEEPSTVRSRLYGQLR